MNSFAGFIAAAISALGWGSYFVPMKRIKKYDAFYFQLLMCAAVFLSGLLVPLFTGSILFSFLGVLSGFLWALGNIMSVLAVKHGGLSRTLPVWAGCGIFVSFFWGTLFFHEITGRKNLIKLAISSIVLFAGAVFLALSK